MKLHPCGSCPYRKDVPSGVWSEDEYDKLPPFDLPSPEQPFAAFFCHQQDDTLCSGWVGCHNMDESIGLRIALANDTITTDQYYEALNYECPVPLFESGQAARDHGVREILTPGYEARRIVEKLGGRNRTGTNRAL